MLIIGRRHLTAVLDEFVDHYNFHRPHRSLGQASPCRPSPFVLPMVPGPQNVPRTDNLAASFMSTAWWRDMDDIFGTHTMG